MLCRITFVIIYPSLALQRCKGSPLSLLGKEGAGPTGLWGALSLEPPELRCLELDLSKEWKAVVHMRDLWRGNLRK